MAKEEKVTKEVIGEQLPEEDLNAESPAEDAGVGSESESEDTTNESTTNNASSEQFQKEVEDKINSIPELKELLSELGKYTADKVEQLFTRVSLLPESMGAEQLHISMIGMFLEAATEIQSKFWPRFIDLIRENGEVADLLKKTGVDVSSLGGILSMMFSTVLPYYSQVFLTGGIISALQAISLDSQQLANNMSGSANNTKLIH